jgi:hypothetical protein
VNLVAGEPGHHALGSSRGGWSTKTHLAVDPRRGVISFLLTPGQAGDSPHPAPPSRSQPTKPRTARLEAAAAADHPRSIRKHPTTGTPSNAASTRKHHRSFATRYDRLAVRYAATIHIAVIDHWLDDVRNRP